ncbi:MAG: glycosyltransferase family 4 protein [Ignavibacteriales bacterium]
MENKINSMPRICLLAETFYPIVGGGESHSRLLSEKLIEGGVDLFVITRQVISNLRRYEIVGKIPVYRVRPSGFKRLGKYLMTIPVFWKLVKKRNEYDILYVCGIRTLGFIAVLISILFRKKCVLRAESCTEMSGGFMKQGVMGRNKLLLEVIDIIIMLRNRILRGADCFISISNVIRSEFLLCNVEPWKIEYIPNGIDTDKFSPVDEDTKFMLRNRLNIPPKKFIFSYSGKLDKGKGLELLLRIWKRLVTEYEGLHLVLIGSGENQFLSCENELRQFVKKYNLEKSMTFTGYVENVNEYLQCSDCFILLSESESFSISLAEALSCELPCIATRVGGIPDFIWDDENGRLADVGDEEGIHNIIVELLKNQGLAKMMGKKGRRTVIERFGIESVMNEYMTLFSSLVEGGRSAKVRHA